MLKLMKLMAGLALAATLAACGGGGGSPGTPNGGTSSGSTGSTGTTAQVANFVMLLDRSTLANGGTATAKLTVLAVDAQNNVVPGATVRVSSDANSVYTPNAAVTDANGLYTGSVGIFGDKSNRTITITTTVGSLVKKTTLQVVGSQIALSSTPAVVSPGGSGTFTARLTDSASVPIAGVTLSFTSDISTLNGQTGTTDSNGNVSLPFTAPSTPGSYAVTVAGSGVSNAINLLIGASGSIPAVTIPAGVTPSLSALPNVVAPNASGSTSNQSQLKFLIVDANNQPIPNVRVRFDITSTGQGSVDSTISSGSSTVYTDAAGVATASFIPGTTSSPTNGVQIRACYQGTDFATTSTCTSSVPVTLTVAQQALAISIGDDNLLQRGSGTYIKQFTITVADSAGRAVPNAPVSISLDIPYYGKGTYSQTVVFPLLIQPYQNNTSVPNATTDPLVYGKRIACINEDLNRNGIVDPGENIDGSTDGSGQPTLQPRRSDILISYVNPGVTSTDQNGILLIKVEYAQELATWEEYHVRASTNVAGSQGTAERAFVTTFIDGDQKNGSFLTPPYGSGSCSVPY